MLDIFIKILSGITETSVTKYSDIAEDYSVYESLHFVRPESYHILPLEQINNIVSHLEHGKIYHSRDVLGDSYIGFKIMDDIVMVGPYVDNIWDESEGKKFVENSSLSESEKTHFKIYYCTLPMINSAKLLDTIKILLSSFEGNVKPYRLVNLSLNDKGKEVILRSNDKNEYNYIEFRYKIENRLIESIKNGDLQGTEKILKMLVSNVGYSEQTLNYEEIHEDISILRALTRKAAEGAGVHPSVIHAITQDYRQQLHDTHNIDTIQHLGFQMVRDLCMAVQDVKFSKYSPTIRRCIDYIHLNYTNNLSVEDIAKVACVSTNHLSRKFKSETNTSITNYIAEKRCKKASELLSTSTMSIQEISNQVGYVDNNYFVKVFKNYYNVTPSEYRKNKSS